MSSPLKMILLNQDLSYPNTENVYFIFPRLNQQSLYSYYVSPYYKNKGNYIFDIELIDGVPKLVDVNPTNMITALSTQHSNLWKGHKYLTFGTSSVENQYRNIYGLRYSNRGEFPKEYTIEFLVSATFKSTMQNIFSIFGKNPEKDYIHIGINDNKNTYSITPSSSIYPEEDREIGLFSDVNGDDENPAKYTTGDSYTVEKITNLKWKHVAITYDRFFIVVYINGKRVYRISTHRMSLLPYLIYFYLYGNEDSVSIANIRISDYVVYPEEFEIYTSEADVPFSYFYDLFENIQPDDVDGIDHGGGIDIFEPTSYDDIPRPDKTECDVLYLHPINENVGDYIGQ